MTTIEPTAPGIAPGVQVLSEASAAQYARTEDRAVSCAEYARVGLTRTNSVLPHSDAVSAQACRTANDCRGLTTAPGIAPAIAELAQLDQWVISKPVPRKGKIDKPPFSPILDDQHDEPWMCSHSNPEHWGSYDTARAALRGFSWLGFVFHESDPYSGVDLDGCRDKDTGVIAPWAERIIQMCNSYTEISPSETGVKIWVRGTLPETIKKSFGPHVGIEVYFKQRYFTMTGNHLPGTPLEIRDAQYALDLLWTEYKPAPQAEWQAE